MIMEEGQLLELPVLPAFGLPMNVSLVARFGGHASALDFGTPEEGATLLRETDLLAPEAPGWDRWLLTNYNKVAHGDLGTYRKLVAEAEHSPVGDYVRAMIEGLFWHGHGLKVILLDVPESSLSRSVLRAVMRQGEVQSKRLPFDRAVESFHGLLVEAMLVNIQREHYVLVNLAPTIEGAIANTPRLRGRTPVRVLILMGAYHQAMGQEIKSCQRELGVAGFSYTEYVQPGFEGLSMTKFGNVCRSGVVPSRELAARVFAHNLVSARHSFSDIEHSGAQSAHVQAIVDSMSMADIRNLYNESR